MNQNIKSIVKKTVKIAGVTCVAAGAVALMTSGVALKTLTEGGKYLKKTIQKIIGDEPGAKPTEEAEVEAPGATEEVFTDDEAPEATENT